MVSASGDQVLTPEEAAAIVKLPVKTVRELCARGEIPARKMGRRWRIPAWFVDALFGKPEPGPAHVAAPRGGPVRGSTAMSGRAQRRVAKTRRSDFLAFADGLDRKGTKR
jgi:excisionase family DNA binding protein